MLPFKGRRRWQAESSVGLMETVPKQSYENARKLATVIRRDILERQEFQSESSGR